MAKPAKSLFKAPAFSFDEETGTLLIKHGGTIVVTQGEDGGWTYQQGANSYTIDADEAALISTIEVGQATKLQVNGPVFEGVTFTGPGSVALTGLEFIEADEAADNKFEPSINMDGIIADGLANDGVAATFDSLASATSQLDSFKLLWDYLDDNYSYYDESINSDLIDLGIIYADHLLEGGEALTDTIAKFTPDGGDAGDSPDRVQSMHDNLLGNFDPASITDKFGRLANDPDLASPEGIFTRVEDAGLGELLDRPIYDGNETADRAPTLAFDADFFGL